MPHYNHAPIAEAIIDLRAAVPDGTDPKVFDGFAEKLKGQFPTAKPITNVQMGFQRKDTEVEGQFDTRQHLVGTRLENPAGDRVLQVQLAGFTYSHLPPYSNWTTFSQEAKALWERYVELIRIPRVTRLAVRVINKVNLPAPMEALSGFSNLLVRLPEGIAVPETFFTQIQVDGSAWTDGCRAIVNAGAAPTQNDHVELLLDFDLFVDTTKEVASPDIWQVLDKLSAAKDALFEACITDRIREIIA